MNVISALWWDSAEYSLKSKQRFLVGDFLDDKNIRLIAAAIIFVKAAATCNVIVLCP